MSMIEFRAVSKLYPGRRVIDALSLKIEVGERVVLFGPSGCGKSTVLHLIAGLVAPESGDILIKDELVAAGGRNLCEPEQRGIGMVFQDLALWPHMTVSENIEFGLRARKIPDNERKKRVRDVVGLVGLGDYLNVKPGELSGGQQQRVALARTLRLQCELGFTLVYVTHNREEAKNLATRTMHLKDGRIDSAINIDRTT